MSISSDNRLHPSPPSDFGFDRPLDDIPVCEETRRMATAAWDKWGATCAWFMPKTDFSTVGKIQPFLRAMQRNGGMPAWNAARNIAKKLKPISVCP